MPFRYVQFVLIHGLNILDANIQASISFHSHPRTIDATNTSLKMLHLWNNILSRLLTVQII
jgi:hypothetical protein